MKFNTIFAAVLAVAGATSAQAMLDFDMGAYTVTYDETTTGFGALAGGFNGGGGSTGFNWNVSSSVLVASNGALATATFALPDFTISVNPGWVLSGPVTGFLGNLVFNEFMGGATTASVVGSVSVDGSGAFAAGGALDRVVSLAGPLTTGYYAGTASAPIGDFSSFSFTGGTLTLTASGPAFASVVSQPQNQLRVSLIATPVPEPETAALMLAGLLTVVSLARRRS